MIIPAGFPCLDGVNLANISVLRKMSGLLCLSATHREPVSDYSPEGQKVRGTLNGLEWIVFCETIFPPFVLLL